MGHRVFRKKPLAQGIALALGAATIQSPALAADAAQDVMEEIVVTGIRGSLERSMDLKRYSRGVVDAISAEDIGDFPDTNLAESLQRITGVSIDRQRGEGARVTVRGFGPDFNLVLLNGRQMPTAAGTIEHRLGRSFDFGNLASEGIASVEVYKSGRADVPSGGIGSTINIKTTRPLEAPGLNLTVAGSAMNDQSRNDGSSYTPEISGLFSNTFADDTVGVALSVVRQERNNGVNTANVGGWRTFSGLTNNSWGCNAGPEEWGGIPASPTADGCNAWQGNNQSNRPGAGDIYSVPQAIGYEIASYDRTRTNGQATFQFRPSDEITATLDYTYSEVELERTYSNLSAWFNFDAQVTDWTDGPNASPILYQENLGGSDYSMGAGQDAWVTENNSVGLNLVWDLNDNLSIEFDYHDSSATYDPNSANGDASLVSIAAYTRNQTKGHFGQDLPILELGLSDPLSADDMVVTGSVFNWVESRMDIDQATLEGNYQFFGGFVESIDFGIQLTEVNNRSASSVVQRDTWFATIPTDQLTDILTPASTAGKFSEVPGGSDSRLQTDYFTFDMNQVVARVTSLIGTASDNGIVPVGLADYGPCNTGLCPTQVMQADRRTTEESEAIYVQANMATEIGDMPVYIQAGLRYEQTDVSSQALSPVFTGINWVSGNELTALRSTSPDFTQLAGDYDAFLPNLDISIDVTEQVVGRASFSKTMTRPNYTDIQGGQTLESLVRIDGGAGSRGNPALLPFESVNIDLSLEFYYGEASYVAVGYFHKDVDNFIGTSSVIETPFDLPHPALGPLAAQARAATGSADAGTLYNWILTNLPNEAGVDAANGIISGVAGRDPVSPFNLTVPVNIEDATMDGWELVAQHNFWDTGFGIIANMTIVDADVGYDNLSLAQQFVLNGLSDSANVVAFYDKDGIGIRLAYNWRDDFLAGTGQTNVGAGPPTYVAAYDQWDLSASYWVTENFQVYLDALNITDETTHVYGRDKYQTLFASQLGPRYNLGVRYKF